MSGLTRLAVVIVSYNTCALLRRCLASLAADAARCADTVTIAPIVVDNHSSDGSAEMVAREFPAVTLVASPENLGFAGGNNRALRLLGLLDQPAVVDMPDCVLLLNPDTEVQPGALAAMARFLARTPDAGACGAHLSYGDGSFQHGAFAFPGLLQVALDLFPLHRLPGASRLYASAANGRYPAARWEGDQPFAVDFVLGAALMARASVFRRVGGLDEGFFMYCEEMDWCLRARDCGWQVYAVPAAHITHFEAQSSRQVRWRSFEQLWRSRLHFYEKHRARFGLQMLPLRLLVRAAMRQGETGLWRRFAAGEASGLEAAQELKARRAVARDWA